MSETPYNFLSGALRSYRDAVEATGSGDSMRWMDKQELEANYKEFLRLKVEVEMKALTSEEESLVKKVRYELGYSS